MGSNCSNCICKTKTDNKKPKTKSKNTQVKQCEICSNPLKKNIQKLSCKHQYHKNCLRQYWQTVIKNKETKLYCPNGCQEEICYYEIKEIVKSQTFEIHEKNLLELCIQGENQFLFCPTGDCVGIYELDGFQEQYFQCIFCFKSFCLICKAEEHGEEDCEKFNQLTQNQIKEIGIQRCPHCQRLIQRIEGCNAIVCTCQNQFCYDCGGTECPHGRCLNKQ